jgi:hypothetical protein
MHDHTEYFSDESLAFDVVSLAAQNIHKAYPDQSVISGRQVQVNTNDLYERLNVIRERVPGGGRRDCVLLRPEHIRAEANGNKTDFALVRGREQTIQQSQFNKTSPWIQGR